jgi:sulfite exporter TauE/SafE
MDTTIAAGFLLGALGSFHCVGMCAPIALALPQIGESRASQCSAAGLYNLGRATTYSLLGAIVGALGMGFMLANTQQIISISIGILLLLSVLLPALLPNRFGLSVHSAWLSKLLSPRLGALMRSPSYGNIYLLGLLNGLLPCGLVYTALAGATLTMQAHTGAIYMLSFGLGTLPLMFLVTYSRNLISLVWRRRLQRLVPIMVMIMGVFFILRGLNLGIPYLSPMLYPENNNDMASLPVCH